jgi:Ca-activated chloride channel family protein
VLDGEKAENKDKIKEAVNSLHAGGGTSGADGLNLAYTVAEKNIVDGNNRIILCTDGDFNIGPSSDAEMEQLITEKRGKGIFISVLGFGMGNYKDSKMELIADKGNGNYAYIDNIREAKKVLADDMTKTLFTIAKDVKIQVEFNPEKAAQYRLIGYENRVLSSEDFDNDKKDAGELGAGASVTALYEIVPSDGAVSGKLKYSELTTTGSDELMTVKLRYKDPNGDESRLIEKAVSSEVSEMSENMTFASSAAQLGMILNNSEYKGTSTLDSVFESARSSLGTDEFGLRREFVQLVDLLRYSDRYSLSADDDFGIADYTGTADN